MEIKRTLRYRRARRQTGFEDVRCLTFTWSHQTKPTHPITIRFGRRGQSLNFGVGSVDRWCRQGFHVGQSYILFFSICQWYQRNCRPPPKTSLPCRTDSGYDSPRGSGDWHCSKRPVADDPRQPNGDLRGRGTADFSQTSETSIRRRAPTGNDSWLRNSIL